MRDFLEIAGYVLLVLLVAFAINVAIWAGLTWLLVWALHGLGIFTIGSFVVAFSWKLVIIIAIVASIFKTTVTVNKN